LEGVFDRQKVTINAVNVKLVLLVNTIETNKKNIPSTKAQ